ncbi:MAG: hypothetical protein M0Q53_04550 [Prolixibacteraceae bacterium]|jgi:hypothetical protein|nr:hypothetical protein [Prolixibacteraceae bacterium]
MKKPYLPILLLAFFFLNNNSLSGQITTEGDTKTWKLIWQDEFNGKALNKKKNVLTWEASAIPI